MIIVGAAVVALLTIGLIFAKLYNRATKETSFVRTGLGGEKVVKDGGAIVLPVLHDTIPVNMNTLRIEVEKIQSEALITKDRLRVDVKADFYLRVAPNSESIAMAAQTLGTRTTRVEEVKKLMESKFVDVLRAVAAEMTMTEMHEQRADFVQKVQTNVANDLEKNGLELESVSLTGFDQTDLNYFNENNAFDAEGRAKLARIIEEKKKETNDVEQTNRVAIERRNLEAERETLDIKKDEEEAKLAQQKELEFLRAAQHAEIVKTREDKSREERQAEIEKEKAIESAEIEKDKDLARRNIEKVKALEEARIQQQRDIEVAEQEKKIAVAVKSEEESAARAKAAEAEKTKVEKEESVVTAKQVAQAERLKQIEVIDAMKVAEREAVGVTVQATAEKQAALDHAEAIQIKAKAEAEATIVMVEADEKKLAVQAAGKQAMHEADNMLSLDQIELKKSLAILQALPEIVANAVKPLENIDGIKILQGYGSGAGTMSGGSNSGGSNNAATTGNFAEQVTGAALNYRANAPLVDAMLRELNLVDKENGTLNDLVSGNSQLINQATTSMTDVDLSLSNNEPAKINKPTSDMPEQDKPA
ncbi:flotillin family protein [Flocculibacter collagenilyticus]|uniref:flotillin family protein n=1 Tax=Flocculibacter collagenilyticus TaxID=2744479 RepID=UPI0038990328